MDQVHSGSGISSGDDVMCKNRLAPGLVDFIVSWGRGMFIFQLIIQVDKS